MKPRPRIHVSPFLSVPLTSAAYLLGGAALGAGAFPSALLLAWAARALLASPTAGNLMVFCLLAGASLYLFFFAGLLLAAVAMRCFSTAVRPGAHRLFSAAGLSWITLSAVQAVAARLLLRLVPGGWLPTLYYRLAGCRIGRDAWIIGVTIMEPHLVSIGDGTVIGGEAVLAPHLSGGVDVYFAPITIGRDCRIGAHSVICAGTTIGDGATVGIHAYLRKGTRVAPGAHVAAPAALAPRTALALEGKAAGRKSGQRISGLRASAGSRRRPVRP